MAASTQKMQPILEDEKMAVITQQMQTILQELYDISQKKITSKNYPNEIFQTFLKHIEKSEADPTITLDNGWNILHIMVRLGDNYIEHIRRIKSNVTSRTWDKLITAETRKAKATPIKMADALKRPLIKKFFNSLKDDAEKQTDIPQQPTQVQLNNTAIQERNVQVKKWIEEIKERQEKKDKSLLRVCNDHCNRIIQYIVDGVDPTIVSDSGWNILHAILNEKIAMYTKLPALIGAIDRHKGAENIWYQILNHKNSDEITPKELLEQNLATHRTLKIPTCHELAMFTNRVKEVLLHKKQEASSCRRSARLEVKLSSNSYAGFSQRAQRKETDKQSPLQSAQQAEASSSSSRKRTREGGEVNTRAKTRRIG